MKTVIKSNLSVLADAIVAPLVIWEKRRAARGVIAFSEVSYLLSRLPGYCGRLVRRQFYAKTLEHVGKNVVFGYGTIVQYRAASIGENVFFGINNFIGEVTIGNDVIVGGCVNFVSGRKQHGTAPEVPFWRQAGQRTRLNVGNNVWIGSNSVVMADIADSCVIGAGSVVTRPTIHFSVYAGNPARRLRQLEGVVT